MMTPDRPGNQAMTSLFRHHAVRLASTVLIVLTMLILVLGHSAAADALAQVNRTTVAEGSTLTLRVRTRDLEQQLDITPLLRDFEVVAQTQSTNNPALTGLGTEFQEWELVLTPRRSGQLSIPPLLVGQQLTQPISIRVIAVSPEQRAVMDRDVFLEVDIANETPYVGEAVLVRLSLFYNVNVNGTFADVNPEQSAWEPLGDSHTGTTERNGNTYSYTRFHYLYTPLEPGERTLPAFEFDGDYRTHNLAPRQTLPTVRSEPIELTVRPVPDDFPSGYPWLPARDLTLSQAWSSDQTDWSAGEQLTRTLTLTARGPAAANLPPVLSRLQQPDGINTYAGSTRTQDELGTEDRVATRREHQEVLFTTAGEHTLPEVRMPWWDLDTDQLRWAEVPGRSLQVAGVMPFDVAPAPDQATESASSTLAERSRIGWLYWGLAALSGVSLAAVGLLLWRRRHQRSVPSAKTRPEAAGRRRAVRQQARSWSRWLWFLGTLPIQLTWRLISWAARPLTRRLLNLLDRAGIQKPSWLTARQLGELWHSWRSWQIARRSAKPADRSSVPPIRTPASQDPGGKDKPRTGASSDNFVNTAYELLGRSDWAGLMTHLSQQLSAQGWPDAEKVEQNLGLSGLADLIRRTQRQQYGRPEHRESDAELAADWTRLLARWPAKQESPKARNDAPGLYPD